tara:strand:- start:669 stop:1112 length:444 start_codon:yes stop_codon:yes gene_type:complete
MILTISVIKTFTYCLVLKIIFFKFFKFKTKNWPYITILTFFLFTIINYSKTLDIFDYFLLHCLFLISYILFLTIVFNESPSVFIFKNLKRKKLISSFKKKLFVKNRLELMKTKGLINNNVKPKLTAKGNFFYGIVIFLSNLFFNEHS